MIEIGMHMTRPFAHIKVGHVTYCGEPTSGAEIPVHPHLCPRCRTNALAEGVSEEELDAIEQRRPRRSIHEEGLVCTDPELRHGPLLRRGREIQEGV